MLLKARVADLSISLSNSFKRLHCLPANSVLGEITREVLIMRESEKNINLTTAFSQLEQNESLNFNKEEDSIFRQRFSLCKPLGTFASSVYVIMMAVL